MNWDALIEFARSRTSTSHEIVTDLISVGMSGGDSIALAYAEQTPLRQAYLFAMNYCAAIAGECVRRGFPPVSPAAADAARAERKPMSVDCFALHEHLRTAFYELIGIRMLLKRTAA